MDTTKTEITTEQMARAVEQLKAEFEEQLDTVTTWHAGGYGPKHEPSIWGYSAAAGEILGIPIDDVMSYVHLLPGEDELKYHDCPTAVLEESGGTARNA
ncbi:MAG: hypothetical protein WA695_01280 [Candidatus Dormiibacterota bacterium]